MQMLHVAWVYRIIDDREKMSTTNLNNHILTAVAAKIEQRKQRKCIDFQVIFCSLWDWGDAGSRVGVGGGENPRRWNAEKREINWYKIWHDMNLCEYLLDGSFIKLETRDYPFSLFLSFFLFFPHGNFCSMPCLLKLMLLGMFQTWKLKANIKYLEIIYSNILRDEEGTS